MSLKSSLGLDGFDLAIQGVLTAVFMGLFIGFGDEEGVVAAAMVLSASLVVLAIRRTLTKRRQGAIEGVEAGHRIAELEQRMSELEYQSQSRIAELEERLDFTERLLAREPEGRKVGPGELRS